MNPRIRELAEQAGFSKDKYGLYWDEDANEEGVDLEKFADLIVKECMELGDKALQDGKWPGDVLKEHFGVE